MYDVWVSHVTYMPSNLQKNLWDVSRARSSLWPTPLIRCTQTLSGCHSWNESLSSSLWLFVCEDSAEPRMSEILLATSIFHWFWMVTPSNLLCWLLQARNWCEIAGFGTFLFLFVVLRWKNCSERCRQTCSRPLIVTVSLRSLKVELNDVALTSQRSFCRENRSACDPSLIITLFASASFHCASAGFIVTLGLPQCWTSERPVIELQNSTTTWAAVKISWVSLDRIGLKKRIFKCISWMNGSLFLKLWSRFLREGFKAYLIAPMSPAKSQTFLSVDCS